MFTCFIVVVFYLHIFFSGQFSVVLNASRQVFTRRTFMEHASFMKKRIKNNTDCIVKQQATKRASFQQAGPNEGITKQTCIVVVCTKQISLWELEKKTGNLLCASIADRNFVITEILTERIVIKPISRTKTKTCRGIWVWVRVACISIIHLANTELP